MFICLIFLTVGCGQAEEQAKNQTCFLTIDGTTLLSHKQELAEEKRELVPEDGILLERTEVSFADGESVFDVLKRVTREQKLHMEYSMTPVYQTAYIEAIGNLYDFDCGELSGWTYSVNGEFPSVGCSQCLLEQGDDIVFWYTCERGKDLKP